MTPQETDPDLPMSVHSLWQRPGLAVSCGSVGALSVAVPAWYLLKEVTIIFITSTIVWPQVNKSGGTQLLSLGFWCTRFCLCPPRVYFPSPV